MCMACSLPQTSILFRRKPAWTDRILYTCSPLSAHVKPESYSGHSEITMSDHRPVSADFSVDVRCMLACSLWNLLTLARSSSLTFITKTLGTPRQGIFTDRSKVWNDRRTEPESNWMSRPLIWVNSRKVLSSPSFLPVFSLLEGINGRCPAN